MRQRKKPSNKKQSHLDYDIRQKRQKAKRYGDVGRKQLKDAKEASKSAGILGTDGISYDGPARRQYNMSRINRYREMTGNKAADAEQTKRNRNRDRLSANIRARQRRKKGY